MRAGVQQARAQGVHLGFFSANQTYWQVRLEPGRDGTPLRTLVGYKDFAQAEDPYATDGDPSNDRFITVRWRDLGRLFGVSDPVAQPENALVGVVGERHQPVIHYLKDTRMTVGVSVPMRLANGGLATFNSVRFDPEPGFEKDARQHVRDIAIAGYVFHNAALATFEPQSVATRHVKLSPRERECLKLCAQGLTAKQIAFRLDRSPATVMLHLKSATRKLGARNRVQAVARAAHYRLLDGAC